MRVNLTYAEAAAVRVVYRTHVYECTARAVARALGWTPKRASGVLQSLARKGIVDALATARDDGARVYDVTPYGRHIQL